jgi:hypothetical protein
MGVFTAAAGLATHIVLLADTAGMQGSQGEQLPLELGDTPLDLVHYADSYIMAIGTCQQKMQLCQAPLEMSPFLSY